MARSLALLAAATAVVTVAAIAVPIGQAGAATSPPLVSHVHGTSVSTTTATIAWTAPTSSSYAGAVVRFARGSHAPASVTSGSAATVSGATASLANLSAGTHFSVSVFSSSGNGVYSKPVLYSFVARPAGVTGLTVTVTGTAATLHWTNPPAGFYSGVAVAYSGFVEPRSLTTAPRGKKVARVTLSSAKATSATIRNLKAGTDGDQTYGVRVWTYNSQHNYSDPVGTQFGSTSVFGVIRDAQGSPITRGLIFVAVRNSAHDGAAGPYRTTADGSYAFRLPKGAYDVCVRAGTRNGSPTGYVPLCWNNTVYSGEEDSRSLNVGQAVIVSTARTAQKNFTMRPGAAVRGTVVSATDGKPLDNVQVVVHDSADNPVYTITATDADGRWRVYGLATGGYYIHLEPTEDFGSKWIGQGPNATGTTGRRLVQVTEPDTTSTAVSLDPAPAARSSRSGT